MQIKGNYKYKSAIIITPEKLRELDSFITTYYSNTNYRAETLNGNEVKFDDIDELLNYDNSLKQKIKKLELRCSYNYDAVMRFHIGVSVPFSFAYTVDIDYVFDNTKDKAHYVNTVNHILDKMKAPYAMLSKFKTLQLWILICLLSLSLLFILPRSENKFEIAGTDVITLILFYVGTNFVGYLIDKSWANLFPPIVYLWGEEINNNIRTEELRKNLFWGVIMSLIVGIVCFFITKPFS